MNVILQLVAVGAVAYLVYQIADTFRLLHELEQRKQEFDRRYGYLLKERDGNDHTA